VHDQTRAIFQRSLEVAKRRGRWKKGHAPDERQHMKLALDTTHILGRGAVKDTYTLLADGIVQVLPLGELPGFEAAVAYRYRAQGGALPDDWRRRSLYVDLTAWAGFLGRPKIGDEVAQDARTMISRTLSGW
jgi:hypothetical protein